MRIIGIALVVLAFAMCLPATQPAAEAATAVRTVPHPSGGGHGHGYNLGYGHGYYGRGYGYYPYYGYRYYPYSYWGWGWGAGWGWGYPGYYGGYYGGYPVGYYYQGYGEVQTQVKPQQAKVFVNGDYAGVTDDYDGWWQRLNIGPGKHRLVFRAPGFQPYVVDLNVMPGGDYNIKYQMQPGEDAIADSEMLPEREARSTRDRNRYRDEDRYRDDDRYQDEGRYQDQGREREPDRTWDQRRPSERGRTPAPAEQTQAGKRQLTLSVQPADATIYVDGNYFGTGDAGNVQILLSDGSHRIEVVRPGYESFEKDILVSETSTPSLTILLQKK